LNDERNETKRSSVNRMDRPRLGDRVEFLGRGVVRVGRVVAVAVTGVHFSVELEQPGRRTLRKITLSSVIRILPESGL